MKFFSGEEFNKIIEELIYSKPACYDTLLYVSRRTLFGSVCKWCSTDSALRGRQYEEDIMQEIQIKLIKKCITDFFKRNDELNYDPDGFKRWLFKVAVNAKNDFAKKARRIQFIESGELDEKIADNNNQDNIISDESLEKLNKAFKTVINADVRAYKVLTWLAQMIIIVNFNVTKIESNDIIEKKFDSMTLDSMLDLILVESKYISWLTLEQAQVDRLRKKLDKTNKATGKRMGDMRYSDFYMKKGAKASISDWINRMNNLIRGENEQT